MPGATRKPLKSHSHNTVISQAKLHSPPLVPRQGDGKTPIPSSTHGDTDTHGQDSVPLLLIQNIPFHSPNGMWLRSHTSFSMQNLNI